jgi:type IV pilus assembly protein PilM
VAGRVVGLDIGTTSVRAAELTLSKGSATLERFGQVALPQGAVKDGEVLDSAAVAAALRQLWAQAKFSSKSVVLGVANQRVVVRQIDLPWLPLEEMRKSLSFQVQDFIPMPVHEAILDFHPLEEYTNESGGRMMRMLLVAAARDMVSNALESLQAAGLRPECVDLTSFAVLRSAVKADALALGTGQAEALVDIGANVTNIVVHVDGVPRFVRVLLMGGADITDALAERLGVPAEQAEAIKQESGLSAVPGQAAGTPAERAIEASASAFVEEIRGSVDYYMAQPGAARLGRLVVSGGGSRLTGLLDRLSTATRLPVVQARPIASVKVGKTGLTPEQLAYVEPMVAVPVGLALGA